MTEPITSPESSKILRAAIWVAIGSLIAAALVCVVWVLIGDDNGIIGKAFLTILLLASFAGVSIAETNLSARRPAWLALASMISWVLIMLIGAFLIWMPEGDRFGVGADRFFKFILIGLIIQGALLHARLYLKSYLRHQTTFTTIVSFVTVGLVVILSVMLVLPLMTEEFVDYRPFYWRVVVALAILAAVGTALIPLTNALFAPKAPRAQPTPSAYYSAPPALSAPWPTYADGATPLPALPDGSPDWNAYYAGHATYAPHEQGTPAAAPSTEPVPPAPPAASGYEGYPPPPPVPPRT